MCWDYYYVFRLIFLHFSYDCINAECVLCMPHVLSLYCYGPRVCQLTFIDIVDAQINC